MVKKSFISTSLSNFITLIAEVPILNTEMGLVDVVMGAMTLLLLLANIYMMSVFVVHRHNLTPNNLLQANMAFCTLLTSFYQLVGMFDRFDDESTLKLDTDRGETSANNSEWGIVLCVLSATSWSFVFMIRYNCKRQDAKGKLLLSTGFAYTLVAFTWLYFAVLIAVTVATNQYPIRPDTSSMTGSIIVFISYILPWSLQSWLFLGVMANGKSKKQTLEDVLLQVRGGKQVFVKTGEESGLSKEFSTSQTVSDSGSQEEKLDQAPVISHTERDGQSLVKDSHILAGEIHMASSISVLLALLLNSFITSTSLGDVLYEIMLCIACITWMNCSVLPFAAESGKCGQCYCYCCESHWGNPAAVSIQSICLEFAGTTGQLGEIYQVDNDG